MKSLTQLSVLAALTLAMNVHELKAQAVVAGAGGIDLNGGGSFSPSAQSGSAVPRFLWLPASGVFRVGRFDSNYSLANSANLGADSVALGYNASATGAGGVALGNSAVAPGANAFAAIGGSAKGIGSVAIGQDGFNPTVAGGNFSVAIGTDGGGGASYAVGSSAVALSGGYAAGNMSFAFGEQSLAGASRSLALGYHLLTVYPNAVVIGSVNTSRRKDGSPPPNSPGVATAGDPIFEIGNGTFDGISSSSYPSNAFTVFRDGTVRLAKASGGIAMGQFQ